MPSGGGGYNSTTSSAPWTGQAKYLTPLFQGAFYGATNKFVNPKYDPVEGTGENKYKYISDESEKGNETFSGGTAGPNFFESDYTAPGALEYYGNETDYIPGVGEQKKDLWQSSGLISPRLAGGKGSADIYGAPTVARFTDAENAARDSAVSLAWNRISNRENSLLGKSEQALRNVVTGANEIPDRNISTPIIASPGTVSGQNINYNPNMSSASINNNPDMRAARVDFPGWTPLGEIASGSSNPYLDEMVRAATRNLQDRYTNEILPSLNSSAEEAGAGGSGAWSDLRAQESRNYLNAIGDTNANIRGNAFNSQLTARLNALGLMGQLKGQDAGYEQEANRLNTELASQKALANAGYEQEANRRNTELGLERATSESGFRQQADTTNIANALQRNLAQGGMEADVNKSNVLLGTQTDTQNIANVLQSLGMSPDINAAGYNDIGALAATGAEQRTYNQDIINAYIQKMEQKELEPWNRLALLSQLIGGNFGGTVTQSARN